MIIGCCGAGKSTFAKKLASKTGLKLYHLDQLYWKPNWVESEKEEWEQLVEQVSQEAEWIIDGNYGSSMDIRLKYADTVFFLDRSRNICLYRVLKRIALNYGTTRTDSAENCPERFDWEFIKYTYHFYETRRPAILEKLANIKHNVQVHILEDDAAAEKLLLTLSN